MTVYKHYFVSCPRGVEDLLLQECVAHGISKTVQQVGGIEFEGDIEQAYKLCLWSRVASRVLLRLHSFVVDDYDALYREVRSIDWSEHMNADSSFAIDCFSAHANMNNSHFAMLRVKDAVVDQFTQNGNMRPDIERDTPDVRINVYLGKQDAAIYLDLSGQALHVRSYRQRGGEAPLRENLAAAILLRCKWPHLASEHTPLFDPTCGSATLLIEAAYIALNRAPGILRSYYGFTGWKQHQQVLWESIVAEARAAEKPVETLPQITGCDISPVAIKLARRNIAAAGFASNIDLHVMDSLHELPELPSAKGLLVTNPPYGKRLGDARELKSFYYRLGSLFKHRFQGWTVAVLTSDDALAKTIGLRAHHKNTLYNGSLKTTLYQYHIRESSSQDKPASTVTKSEIVARPKSDNAIMFENRLRKNLKHFGKWARRQNISCYRLYDADLPQYALAIDLYGSQAHVQEYKAPSEIDDFTSQQRLHEAIDVIAEVLELQSNAIVLKTRMKQSGSEQYIRQDETGRTRIVDENGLKFVVNLHDYLDTGLFLDHRITRKLVGKLAAGRHFLNLFAYTGTASVYAAAGSAASTTTVDMSNTYLDWAQDNMALNGFSGAAHTFERADCLQWLWDAWKAKRRFQLIFLDPPTFSNSKKMQASFDVTRDHVQLLEHAMRLLDKDGILVFSTNARRFKLDTESLAEFSIEDITSFTTSEDFKRKPAHRCWCISREPLSCNWTELTR